MLIFMSSQPKNFNFLKHQDRLLLNIKPETTKNILENLGYSLTFHICIEIWYMFSC